MPYAATAVADTMVQELTAADVRQLSRQHAYTWVVIWAPWCEPWQQLARELRQEQARLASQDVNLVLVDIQYSPRTAMGLNTALRGGRPGYTINWRYYGDQADLKFRQELAGTPRLRGKKRYANHFVLNQQQQLVLTAESLPSRETLDRLTELKAASQSPAIPPTK